MQIHEITRGPVNEGILKGVANRIGSMAATAGRAVAAVPGAIAQNVLDRAKAATGIDVSPATPGAASASGRQALAGQISASLVKSTAQQQAKSWDQTLNELVKRYGAPGGPRWPINLVKADLDQIINQDLMRNLTQWDKIQSTYARDPSDAKRAREIQKRIAIARNTILAVTPRIKAGTVYTADDLKASWEALVAAAFDAQNLVISKQYGPRSTSPGGSMPIVTFSPSGIPLFDGQPFNPTDPRHVAAKKALKIP